MRLMTSSRSADSPRELLLFPAMLFLLGFQLTVFQLAQVVVQTVEALLPVAAVALHPVGDLLERLRLQPAGPPLRLAPARDQSRVLQYPEVLRNCRKTHLERLGQLPNRGFST